MTTTGDQIRTSTASAIDLAGSEDNRRTDNGKERLVESASINKSLFVLAQCVEAISRKQARIPYRESKMTRILSLGQNNGLTIMILNLAPVRSYHLDTLSSLNFANRTKKIEVREMENEPVFKGCSRPVHAGAGVSMQRQPLRPLATSTHNSIIRPVDHPGKAGDKPAKAFSVYFDKTKPRSSNSSAHVRSSEMPRRSSPLKRPSDSHMSALSRPAKTARRSPPTVQKHQPAISKATIEDMVERKVTEILAARALDQQSTAAVSAISKEVQRRLDVLEQKIEGKDGERVEGLTFLLMAKQHSARGEDLSALKMYELAKDHFPDNTKLETKIVKLQEKLKKKRESEESARKASNIVVVTSIQEPVVAAVPKTSHPPAKADDGEDSDYRDDLGYQSDDGFRYKPKIAKLPRLKVAPIAFQDERPCCTPRTTQLLAIINTRDIGKIRSLKGVGAKKAEAIVAAISLAAENKEEGQYISNLNQLGRLKGVGAKTVENMRLGMGETDPVSYRSSISLGPVW